MLRSRCVLQWPAGVQMRAPHFSSFLLGLQIASVSSNGCFRPSRLLRYPSTTTTKTTAAAARTFDVDGSEYTEATHGGPDSRQGRHDGTEICKDVRQEAETTEKSDPAAAPHNPGFGAAVAAVHVHENVLMDRYAADVAAVSSLDSLFDRSRLSKNAVTEGEGEDSEEAAAVTDRSTDVEANCNTVSPEEVECIDSEASERADAFSATHDSGSSFRPDVVSHGEEEIEEDRVLFAQDGAAEAIEGEAPPPGAPLAVDMSAKVDPQTEHADHRAEETEKRTSTRAQPRLPTRTESEGNGAPHVPARTSDLSPPTTQDPISLMGAAYAGEMAAALRRAAQTHRFLSPFWSPRSSYQQVGATVEVPNSEGVLLPTFMSRSIRVFNLEQTDLRDRLRGATVGEVRSFVMDKMGGRGTRRDMHYKPRTLSGTALAHARALALCTSPLYLKWQDRCPYWVSKAEAESLGATVKPEEADQYITVPYYYTSRAKAVTDGERFTAAATPAHDSEGVEDGSTEDILTCKRKCADEPQTDAGGADMQLYNVKQLEDTDGRFDTMLKMKPEVLPRCYGIRGTRYCPVTTFLMWEYCLQFHFPMTEKVVVLLTAERLRSMGGRVLPIRRFPPTANASSSSSSPAIPEANSTKATQDGIVPPPFTMVVRDEVVTLFHALQTDIPETIFAQLRQQRAERFQFRVGYS